MDNGQESNEISTWVGDPRYAEGEVQLPGSENQEGKEGWQEQECEAQQEQECEAQIVLTAAKRLAQDIVCTDPALAQAFKSLAQLIRYIEARVSWRVI